VRRVSVQVLAAVLFSSAVTLSGLSCTGIRAYAADKKSESEVVHPIPRPANIRVALDVEYDELVRRIYRLRSGGWVREYRERFDDRSMNLRGLVEEQAYHKHALVHRDDADPLEVVLRRTGALVDYYRTREIQPKDKLDAWQQRLDVLAAGAERIQPKSDWKDAVEAWFAKYELPVGDPLRASSRTGRVSKFQITW